MSMATALHDLLDLFAADLPGVTFPDVDAGRLMEAAREVEVARESVTRAEAALEAARADLAAREEALLQKAQRALAYARVYAEDKPELLERLSAVELTRSSKSPRAPGETPTPKKRGRPRKDERSASFFEAPPALEQ